ncbi:hypothetical protein RRG08_024638 [Elysia crispata]|uniref:Uncharacterized protein n=1 Tax=Elysia crispata TaxID=231223 RepID=A0AAE1DNA3_9GAST|nr:hypothetical protein RRG08_024638 [Elysia crispata]
MRSAKVSSYELSIGHLDRAGSTLLVDLRALDLLFDNLGVGEGCGLSITDSGGRGVITPALRAVGSLWVVESCE